jgi:hypothetical protein
MKMGGGCVGGVLVFELGVFVGDVVVVVGEVVRPPVPPEVVPPVPPEGAPPFCAKATVAAKTAKPANRIAVTIAIPPTDLDYTLCSTAAPPAAEHHATAIRPTLIEDLKEKPL